MIRFGNISSIDAARARVRVQFADDGIVSHWLPVLVQGSRGNQYFHIFEVNEHVVCLMDEHSENGVVLGAIYDANNTPSGTGADIAQVQFADGAELKYDRSVSTLTITVGASEMEISPTGFAITKGGESLRTMVSDLIDQLVLETHTVTAVGSPTGPPLNLAAYQAIKARVLAFFTG